MVLLAGFDTFYKSWTVIFQEVEEVDFVIFKRVMALRMDIFKRLIN